MNCQCSVIFLMLTVTNLDAFPFIKQKFYRNVRLLIGPCHPNQTKFQFKFLPKDMKITGGVDSITYENKFEILEDLHAPIRMTIVIRRCPINNRNDCPIFKTLEFPDFCAGIQDGGSPLAQFAKKLFRYTDPPLGCPVQEIGKYVTHKTTIDMSPLAIFPFEGFHWKLRAIIAYGEPAVPVLCGDMSALVTLVASKKQNK